MSFPSVVQPGLSLRYEHKNQKSQQITGYSDLSYQTIEGNRIEEHLQNKKPDGHVFQEKISQYDLSGNLLVYQETDHRNGLHIEDRYQDKKIYSFIAKGDQTKDLVIEPSKDLVPFELLVLYLKQNLDHFLQGKDLQFTLFIPQIGLNFLDITQIGVIAKVIQRSEVQSPRGKEPTITLEISPSNALLQSLLPKDKGRFQFTFLTTEQRLLYQFTESSTVSTLIKINEPK